MFFFLGTRFEFIFFFFSSRRRHTRLTCDWSSDVCSSDLAPMQTQRNRAPRRKAVPRHRGIYYRPRPDGKIAPPYEIFYVDSTGKQRWETIDGTLEDAE